jgi:chromate transporter
VAGSDATLPLMSSDQGPGNTDQYIEVSPPGSTVAAGGPAVPLKSAILYWLKLGFINFGGPAGQIAIMHEELVDRKRWISNNRFLHALNYCMLLPGPEAQQLAIYIGWLLNGTWAGIAAGVLFVLPAFFIILGLSWTYAVHGDIEWVEAVFYGLRAAVIALVLAALIRVGAKALHNRAMAAVAAGAFVAIFFVKIPFPLIILAAALIGLVLMRLQPRWFPDPGAPSEEQGDVVLSDHDAVTPGRPGRHIFRTALLGLVVWWGPLVVVMVARGVEDTLTKEAIFFSQAALVTFGGAYAVLSYINEAAVRTFGWLSPGQMVVGLGLAESTPGPLILVTVFVGYLGAYRFPGGLDPAVAGALGAAVTAWATFAPCFLWIFLGAPYIESLRGNRILNAALACVTAAVVGIILNLGVVFALAALFAEVEQGSVLGFTFPLPDLGSIDVFAALLATAAFMAIWTFRLHALWVVGGCAVAGLAYRMLI